MFEITACELAEIIHNVTRHIPRPDGSLVPHWKDLNESDRLNAVKAVNVICSQPQKTAEELHGLWVQLKLESGWSYGSEYSLEKLTHPCLVHFNDLPDTEIAKDEIWESLTRIFRNHVREEQ